MRKSSSLSPFASNPAWPLLGMVIAWGLLMSQVQHHWGGESYYNFGPFVPFLALWLLLRNLSQLALRPATRLRWHILLSFLAIIPIIPFHAFSEINPFWRLPFWIQATGICAYTGLAIHTLYGWKGLRASIYPVFFLCTMIPWPYRFEILMVQSLTGIVTSLAVSGLHFMSYPVELAGNSITLNELSIGVNDACSGIRSLQALFMVTLFLGSLFAQSTWRRLAAVAVLPLIVIVVNSFRAIFLSVQVITNGDEAYQSWHDSAGYIAFGVSMLLIYACIEVLNIGSTGERNSQAIDFRKIAGSWRVLQLPKTAPMLTIAPILLFAVVEGWFKYHEARVPPQREWTLVPPEESQRTKYLEIHPSIKDTLGFSYGTRFVEYLPNEKGVEVYFYGYEDEDKLASVSSFVHSPSVCMTAIGARKLKQFPDLIFRVGDLALPVKHYLFELPGRKTELHVFWIFWEHRNMDIDPEDTIGLDYSVQWKHLIKGRRDYRRQVFLASMIGYPDGDSANEAIQKLLKDWIRLKTD